MFTLLFKDLGKNDASVAGGKWASLGEMTRAGIPVPPGFVVLSGTFDRFLQESGLVSEIDSILSTVDNKQIHTVEDASEKIQALIRNAHFPLNIAIEIKERFHALGAEYVAVRSSATAEDGADHAWAGQLDSYLNTTEANLLEKIQSCWASLFTPRAIFYRFEKGLHATRISVAVVVQKMVESEVSGIAFSVHPVTEDRNQIIIEAGYGLGEAIVSGQITPDSYVVGKNPRKILDANIAVQTRGIFRANLGGDEWRNIGTESSSQQKLDNEQILELSRMILRIEEHYGFPCDIEWAYEGGEFFIVQSRPITTLIPGKTTLDVPSAKNYTLTYEWRWLKPLFYDFWCQWYLPDKSVVIYRDGLCSQFYSRDFMVKMNETGEKFFLNTENVEGVIARFEKLVRECDLQAKALSVGSVPVSEKETREAFDLLVDIQEEYAYFDFPYTDGAYALSEQDTALATTLQSVEQKKNAYRENFNEIFFEPTGLFFVVLRKLSEQFSVSEEDLQWYLGDDIIALFRGESVSSESLNERKLAYVFDKTSQDAESGFLQGSQALSFIADFGDVASVSDAKDGIQGVTANKTGDNIQGRAYVLQSDYANFEKMRREMEKMPQGDILVMVSTAPEHMDAIRKASAIVTDVGGMLSHTAIVSREFGIPSIVGTGFASKAIKTGDLIEVDADSGVVKILERTGEYTSKIRLEKGYTRDATLIFQQSWVGSVDHPIFSKLKTPYALNVVDYMNDGTIEIWINTDAIEWIKDTLQGFIRQDPDAYSDLLDTYEDGLKKIRKYWTTSAIDNVEYFEEYVDLAYEIVREFDAMYFASLDKRTPDRFKDRVVKMREADNLMDSVDRLIRNTLVHLYPHLKGYEQCILRSELKNPPSLDVLKKRKQSFVVIGQEFAEQMTLSEYAGQHPELHFHIETPPDNSLTLTGETGSKGYVKGIVRIMKRKEQVSDAQEGDILVSPMTTPDFVPAMQKAAAFITDEGGITCHAAIIARELSKPCIIGTKFATQVLWDGDLVEVDADNGVVKILKRAL